MDRMQIVTSPDPAVSLVELKQALRIDHSDWDNDLQRRVAGATAQYDGMDGYVGKALMPQTWDFFLDEFPSEGILIPLGPLISIDSIHYYAADGVETLIDAESYEVDPYSIEGWVVPAGTFAWPTTLAAINAVRVRFTAGHLPGNHDLEAIKEAIILRVGRAVGILRDDEYRASERAEMDIVRRAQRVFA